MKVLIGMIPMPRNRFLIDLKGGLAGEGCEIVHDHEVFWVQLSEYLNEAFLGDAQLDWHGADRYDGAWLRVIRHSEQHRRRPAENDGVLGHEQRLLKRPYR